PYVSLGARSVVQAYVADARGQGTDTPPVASAGTGTLSVDARNVDLAGDFALTGSGNTRVTATEDIRLIGMPTTDGPRQSGTWRFAGNFTLAAAQVYPASQTDFTFASEGSDGGRLTVTSSPRAAVMDPLSAGGTVTFQVNDFVADGRIVAPQGAI